MSLLKSICEDINSYKAFLETILEKVERFEIEISNEKRLGLTLEAPDYYHQDKANKDVVDFQAPTEPVAKPQQKPEPQLGPQGGPPKARIHIVYDPSTGRIQDAQQTSMFQRPSTDFVEANADQLDAAIKHLNRINPQLADKIVNGTMAVWIPRVVKNPNAAKMATMQHGGMNKKELSPEQLANARTAASKMSLA